MKKLSPKIIFLLILISVVIILTVRSIKSSKQDAMVDALREDYKAQVVFLTETIGCYDFVKEATIYTRFETEALSQKIICFQDDVFVDIVLADKYDALSPRQQCKVLCGIDEKARKLLQESYGECEYSKYLRGNSIYDCFLQDLFGKSCKVLMDKLACPFWTKLQGVPGTI